MNAISIESLVVDDDIVKSVNRILDGVRVDEDRLAFEVIKNNASTSEFMSDSHTMKYFREETWIPNGNITDRSDANDWAMSGGKTTLDRAHNMIDECWNEYKGPHISEDTRQIYDIKNLALFLVLNGIFWDQNGSFKGRGRNLGP